MMWSWENVRRISVAVYSGRYAQPGHVAMLKGCIFHWQIFRGGFNAEKYVDDEKLLFSAEHERLKFIILEWEWRKTKNNIIVFLFLIFEIDIENTRTKI